MIEEKLTLSLNPFWLAELIEHFVDGYSKPTPFQLAFLMVPLVLRSESRLNLRNLNKNSTIYSAFLDSADKRKRVSALQIGVENYRDYTKDAFVVYASKGNEFDVLMNNSDSFVSRAGKTTDTAVKDYFKAAYNLGLVFAKEDLACCFYKLGVFSV